MRKLVFAGLAMAAWLAASPLAFSTAAVAEGFKALSDKTVTGFKFPESVGCDVDGKVLYVSQFGSELKPTQKDGKGRIAKVSLSGHIEDPAFLPAAGQTLNKPKGIWIRGGRLWTTDIDVVWVFDLKTRKGRSVALPGIKFANDPTVVGNALFVSDNRGDQLYKVEPADFLDAKGEPKVTRVFAGKGVHPNGLYPAHDGSLLMVGFKSKEEPKGIYIMAASGGEPKALSGGLGRLDGVYQSKSGTLLVTDWNSGAFASWTSKKGLQPLATGFKGPADFCIMPHGKGLTAYVPDLVKSEVRIIELGQ